MAATQASKKRCIGDECNNEVGTLQCPTCLKLGKESTFCSQDCFKRSWANHKQIHKSNSESPLRAFDMIFKSSAAAANYYNPFPTFPYTGSLRPVYPLSPRRSVPGSIPHPDYAVDGIPKSERKWGRNKIAILDKKEQDGMRKVCRLAREVLDIAGREVRPGITTDYLDEVVHKACLERNVSIVPSEQQGPTCAFLKSSPNMLQSYPSTLNYVRFPKSLCTSPNEVICHGIPDQRVLIDGDILNLDVTLYHGGFHGDLNETYYVGEKALADEDSIRVVETARECLDQAIAIVKPGMAFKDPGGVIEKHAKSKGCGVIKTYCGHGINQLFHCVPDVPHYTKNKAVGIAKPGMCFTIEPMISLGTYKDKTWPDDWTSVTQDGSRTAQFEHTLLVTEDGVEVLTARVPDSPGGPVSPPVKPKGGSTVGGGESIRAEPHTQKAQTA